MSANTVHCAVFACFVQIQVQIFRLSANYSEQAFAYLKMEILSVVHLTPLSLCSECSLSYCSLCTGRISLLLLCQLVVTLLRLHYCLFIILGTQYFFKICIWIECCEIQCGKCSDCKNALLSYYSLLSGSFSLLFYCGYFMNVIVADKQSLWLHFDNIISHVSDHRIHFVHFHVHIDLLCLHWMITEEPWMFLFPVDPVLVFSRPY